MVPERPPTYNRATATIKHKRNSLAASGSDHRGIHESLANALSGSMTWEWDDRFGGILGAFEMGEQDRVSAVLASHFPSAWDSGTIQQAPAEVSGAMERFGGLHPGQLLYHAKLNANLLLLGLWWPWSNGATISIRFIPHHLKGSDSELEELRPAMKRIFGLQPP